MTGIFDNVSIILPARNETRGLSGLLPRLAVTCRGAELIVVDDGSEDDTAAVAKAHGAQVIRHPYSKGNGAAIKTGARIATREIIVCLDADGQHRPEDIIRLLSKLNEGFDMVVGARNRQGQASLGRWIANTVYNRLSSWMVGHQIQDLTSGFRVVRAKLFRGFLYLLPNGFSYPTTITMTFFRAGYSVGYVPIDTGERDGNSHIRPLRDGVRFLLVIFRIGTLYSPLKIFIPISLGFFLLGTGYYLYTYFVYSRFTNMSALLLTTSVIVGLIGLVSEQITNLLYSSHQTEDEDGH